MFMVLWWYWVIFKNDYVKITAIIYVLISFIFYLRKWNKESDQALKHIEKKRWYLNNDNVVYELLGSSVVTRYLLILHFKALLSNQKRFLLIFPDTLQKPHLKTLRRITRISYL